MNGTFLYHAGAGLLVLLAACSKNSLIQEDKREKAICKASADANELRVIGGIEDNHIFPTSVLLSIVKGATVETCTGAFISDSLLLTAGHCLKNADELFVGSEYEPFRTKPPKSKEFLIHAEYKEEFVTKQDAAGNNVQVKTIPLEVTYADIGIAKFAPGTAPQSFIARLSPTPPTLEEAVYIVGYGARNLNGEGVGVKRFGKNKIAAIYENFSKSLGVVGLKNPGGQIADYNTVATAGGDSGGALYNVKGEIMGTVSSGVELAQFPDNVISVFTNIHAEKTRKFLEPILKELEAKNTPPKVETTPISMPPPEMNPEKDNSDVSTQSDPCAPSLGSGE